MNLLRVNKLPQIIQLSKYCIVGALGLVIDGLALVCFIYLLKLDPLAARIFSILIALTLTWFFHRIWTFESKSENRLSEWSRFLTVNMIGGAINYSIYFAVLQAFTDTWPLFALACGSLGALLANYLGSNIWVFRYRSEKAVSNP